MRQLFTQKNRVAKQSTRTLVSLHDTSMHSVHDDFNQHIIQDVHWGHDLSQNPLWKKSDK